jgi:hypothetical protein
MTSRFPNTPARLLEFSIPIPNQQIPRFCSPIRNNVISLIMVLVVVASPLSPAQNSTIEILAATGDPEPGYTFVTGGTVPEISASGAVVHQIGFLDGFQFISGIAVAKDEKRTIIAAEDKPPAGTPGVWTTGFGLSAASISHDDTVAFQGTMSLPDDEQRTSYFISKNGQLTEVASIGDEIPNGGLFFNQFAPGPFAALNDGRLIFQAFLGEDPSAGNIRSGIFHWDGNSLQTRAIMAQQVGNRVLTSHIDNPIYSDDGTVAFRGILDDGSHHILVNNGSGLSPAISEGDTAIGGETTTVANVGSPVISPDGNSLACFAFLSNEQFTDIRAIVRKTGGTLNEIARQGDTVPGGGNIGDTLSALAVGNQGQVVFETFLTNTDSGFGLFLHEAGEMKILFREGDPAPGTAGFFDIDSSRYVEINSQGDIAFSALVTDHGQGLFVRLADGSIHKVILVGDTLGTDTVSSVWTQNLQTRTGRGLNHHGQMAITFQTENNSNTLVGRWNPPDFPVTPPRVVSLQRETSGNFSLSFQTLTNRQYEIGFSETLKSFQPLITFAGNGRQMNWTDDGSLTPKPPSASPKRFYQIKVTDSP